MNYPAITVPVQITAEEHARIAAFCEQVPITVAQYVTFAGIGVSVDEYENDSINRRGLLENIAERFGGKVSEANDMAAPAHTIALEFSGQAWALVEALRVYDGHASVEDYIRASIASSFHAFCEGQSASSAAAVLETFVAPGEGGES